MAPWPSASICCWSGLTSSKRGEDGGFTQISPEQQGRRAPTKFRIDNETEVTAPLRRSSLRTFLARSEGDRSFVATLARLRVGRAAWHEKPSCLEAHVGTFRNRHYRALSTSYDHLAATGITALELMPLAIFRRSRAMGL